MKKIFIFFLCTVCLCSCSDKKTENSESAEENPFTETFGNVRIETAETVSDSGMSSAPINLNGATILFCGKSLDIVNEDKFIRTINLDFQPVHNNIVIKDFNFDGYDDMFITADGESGEYYLCEYDGGKITFIKNKQLCNISSPLEISTNCLINTDGTAQTAYIWNNGILVPYREIQKYTKSDGFEITETFAYKNDYVSKILIDCEAKSTETGETEYIFVNPQQVYFEVDDSLIKVRMLKNNETVQTIECQDIYGYETEVYDYDFDGYSDLFVRTSEESNPVCGKYFRFNPDSCRFEEWQELSEIGVKLTLYDGYDDRKLAVAIKGENWYEARQLIYRWENGTISLCQRNVGYRDGDSYMIDIYTVYPDGTEKLYGTYEQ